MVTISELEQDLTVTGREVVVADDGEFGTTKQIVLTEVSVTPAASIALLLANYIKEVGLGSILFSDGTTQSTAAGSTSVGSPFYMIGDANTDWSVRVTIEQDTSTIMLGLRTSGVWLDAPLLSFGI